jgi:hypothetical protein
MVPFQRISLIPGEGLSVLSDEAQARTHERAARLGRLLWGRPAIFVAGALLGGLLGGFAATGGFDPLLRVVADLIGTPAPPSLPAPVKTASAPTPLPAVVKAVARAPDIPALKAAAGSGVAAAAASGPIRPLALGRTVTIGVFGDSLADGLWAGLYRDLHEGKTFNVVKYSQVSTGLTRYDYVDIQAKTDAILAAHHVDIAVIMFGTNDQQGMIDGKAVYPFASPQWRATYMARIDALVASLRRQGATVYWVGLPKMRGDSFDQRASLLNAIYQQRMAALGVPFLASTAVTTDESGGYAAYLAAPGGKKKILMRANDGIHMSMAGYLRVAAPVAERIRADLAASAPRIAVSTPAAGPGVVSAALTTTASAHP